ncbi:transaldolase family protein [Cytobacillus sp. Hz8]|uniref:transaldolase family protein n=1 Tax=Cytobacillus sp. Hz8 TaxID=3347168 RepID=UPI0035E2C6ED
MKILIDSANVEKIRELNEYYTIDGVTTNPTILAKEKKDYIDVLKEIHSIIGNEKMLHVQVVAQTAEKMVKEAELIRGLIEGNIFIKVPVTKEGYKAMKTLSENGYNVLATAVFTVQQALMAAKCGAKYIAPYVNRIDNASRNGVQVVSDIVHLLSLYGLQAGVLAASFKNISQVHQCSLAGAQAVTCNPEIIEKLVNSLYTDKSVCQFTEDWKNSFGKDSF